MGEEKKMRLAFCIPTLNRQKYLQFAIDRILELKESSTIQKILVISNSASEDDTSKYLDQLKSTLEIPIHIHNKIEERKNFNYVYLSKILPKNTDWVWIHCDDDYLLRTDVLDEISNLFEIAEKSSVKIILLPQAKRSTAAKTINIDLLSTLCARFGYHEMLGWLSGILIRREEFMKFASHFEKLYENVFDDSDVRDNGISPYPHSKIIFEQLRSSNAIFYDAKVIEEQIIDPEKKKLHVAPANESRFFRECLFFLCDEIYELSRSGDIKFPKKFYRYVNKSFFGLLVNIIIEDLNLSKEASSVEKKIELLEKLIVTVEESEYKVHQLQILEFIKITSTYKNNENNKEAIDKNLLALFQLTKVGFYPELINYENQNN